MSTNHDRQDWNLSAMEHGRPQGRPPSRQLDEGTYNVTMRTAEGDTVVGMVFVEGTGDSFACTEHWVLSDQYVSPRPGYSLIVEAAEESHSSRAVFFDTMRMRAQDWEDCTYIEAVCQPSKAVPES